MNHLNNIIGGLFRGNNAQNSGSDPNHSLTRKRHADAASDASLGVKYRKTGRSQRWVCPGAWPDEPNHKLDSSSGTEDAESTSSLPTPLDLGQPSPAQGDVGQMERTSKRTCLAQDGGTDLLNHESQEDIGAPAAKRQKTGRFRSRKLGKTESRQRRTLDQSSPTGNIDDSDVYRRKMPWGQSVAQVEREGLLPLP